MLIFGTRLIRMVSMIKKLLDKLNSLRSNPLAFGSFLMMVSSVLGNFLNYVFNVFIVRLLGPNNYGVFASLISLQTVFSVPSAALTTATAKFTAQFKGEGSGQKIGTLFVTILKILCLVGFLISALSLIFASQIASFLNIQETLPIVLIGLSFLIILPQTATTGVLQGLQSFSFISLNGIFSTVVKLVAGLGLVSLGLSVNGALLGLIIAFLLPFFSSLYVLRAYFVTSPPSLIDWRSFLKYTPMAALATYGLTSLITTDIILVKHFFSSTEAGIYSSLSLVGRVILFFSSPIPSVMFPIIAERHASQRRYHHYLLFSILLVGLASLSITIFYFLFPEFSINFFFGQEFLRAAPYLGSFGIFITLYSICNVLTSFFLSIHKTNVGFFLLFSALLQWVLISIFHDNFTQVITSSIVVLTLLTVSLLLYLRRSYDFRHRPNL